MKKITPFISFVLLLVGTNIFAQSQEQMQKMMEYMNPGPMHQMLAKADGSWNEEITMWETADGPPQKMTATSAKIK